MTSSTETLNSSARKWRKRAESSTPAIPTTLWNGSPEYFCSAHTITSSGLVMQMTKALGAYFLMPAPTWLITLRLISSRSSRLMPGLRATPAVTITTSHSLSELVAVGARVAGIEALDGRAFGDVERLALRHPFQDVEQHDIAQFLEAGEVGERAADHAAADQTNLAAGHGLPPLLAGRSPMRSYLPRTSNSATKTMISVKHSRMLHNTHSHKPDGDVIVRRSALSR